MKTDDLLSKLFSNNPDTYARASANKHPVPAPMSDQALVRGRHLTGVKRAGAYSPDTEGFTIYGGLDLDGESHKEAYQGDIDQAWEDITEAVPSGSYITVRSKSGTGFHFWFVFEEKQDAASVRKYLTGVVHAAGLWDASEARPVQGVEIFPKQNIAKKCGNFLWLPYFNKGLDHEIGYEFLSEIPDMEPAPGWEEFVSGRRKRNSLDGLPPARINYEDGEWRDINDVLPDSERAAELLGELDPDIGYEQWYKVLASFQTCYGEEAYDAVKNWAWMGLKWDEQQFDATWDSFEGGSDLGFGTFVYILRDNGYTGRVGKREDWKTKKREMFRKFEEWTPSLLTLDEVVELETTSDQEIAEHLMERLYGHEDETPIILVDGMLWQYDPPRGTYVPLKDTWVYARIGDYDGEYTRVIIDTQGNQTKPKRVRISHHTVKSIYRQILVTAEDWGSNVDSWPVGVGFQNGFLSADGLIEHSPNNLCRHWVDCEFDEDAHYAEWDSFLEKSLDSAEEIRALQVFSGALFMGASTEHERALLLHGPGGSGKSTFLETMKELVPEEFRVHIAPQDMDKDDYVIADMAGKKLNLVTDIDVSGFEETSKFKRAVEGTAMRARQPGKESFSLKPQAAHVFATNSLPNTVDATDGFFRRWLLIGFSSVVPEEDRDPEFKKELIRKGREESWLYAWAWKGWKMLQENGGLVLPENHRHAISDWKSGSNSFHHWYQDMTEPVSGANDWEKSTDLHTQYIRWCHNNNYRSWEIKSSIRNFGILMTETQAEKKRKKDGVYYNVRLKKKRGF